MGMYMVPVGMRINEYHLTIGNVQRVLYCMLIAHIVEYGSNTRGTQQ